MSSEGLRRSITLSVAGLASLTLVYYVYRSYAGIYHEHEPSASLHRSNAVRRAHPRHTAREPEDSPLGRALEALSQTQRGIPAIGEYTISGPEETGLERDTSLDLTLPNLRSLATAIAARHPEWDESRSREEYYCLKLLFVKTLVTQFWPVGHLVSEDDKSSLAIAFQEFGIDQYGLGRLIDRMNSNTSLQIDGAADQPSDDVAEDTHPEENDETLPVEDLSDAAGSQNMLNLLFNIAGEQAKRNGYVHRGIECNGCGVVPIEGVRYHCANCFDYDLCETCESHQVHTKTHVFYKVRIPAPSRGQIKQVLPKWYPGNPNILPHSLERSVLTRLVDQSGMDRTEVEALFEQFKCLAGHEYAEDPCHLGMAIDRKGFDMYFIPGSSGKATPANLIYDRIFSFYDTNDDSLIGFHEFLNGLARAADKSRMARLRRIFDGYDLDGDGYVCRKDFLRMFRAYYDLSRQLNRETINAQEDFGYLDEEIREVVQGSQPISAAFGGSTLYGHASRSFEDKHRLPNGDLQIINGPDGVLQSDLDIRGDRNRAIGNAAIADQPRTHPFRTFRTEPPQDEQLMQLPARTNFELIGIQHADDANEEEISGPNPPIHPYGWPPLLAPESDDIIAALGADVAIDDIHDPVDRTRVIFAQSQRLDADSDRYQDFQREKAAFDRWKKRQFYLDQEEGFVKPQGYTEPDSSDDESEDSKPEKAGSRRQSLRSRSSSKVRFDESAIDTDYETRSNASSRSIPQNERWGGYELSQPEFDVGRDVLYEAVQQGFNKLLDELFKAKEEQHLEEVGSRRDREKWHHLLDAYAVHVEQEAKDKEVALEAADKVRTDAIFAEAESAHVPESSDETVVERSKGTGMSADDVKEAFGDQIKIAIAAAVSNAKEASLHSRPADSIDDEEPHRDPTLPQFRPDSAEDSPKPVKPEKLDPPPRPADFEKWLQHRKFAEEAKERGGPGKLDFLEFRRKMVTDDEASSGLEDENDPAYWEKSADLGRLAFVGTWLEMAQF